MKKTPIHTYVENGIEIKVYPSKGAPKSTWMRGYARLGAMDRIGDDTSFTQMKRKNGRI